MDEKSNTMDIILKISELLPTVINQTIYNINTKKLIIIIKIFI